LAGKPGAAIQAAKYFTPRTADELVFWRWMRSKFGTGPAIH
jgi:hypothetical protein